MSYNLHGTIEDKLRDQLEMADREMGAMRHAVEFSMAARDSLGDRLGERKQQIEELEQEAMDPPPKRSRENDFDEFLQVIRTIEGRIQQLVVLISNLGPTGAVLRSRQISVVDVAVARS